MVKKCYAIHLYLWHEVIYQRKLVDLELNTKVLVSVLDPVWFAIRVGAECFAPLLSPSIIVTEVD